MPILLTHIQSRLALAASAVVLVLAGCGGGGDSAPPPPAPTPVPTPPTPPIPGSYADPVTYSGADSASLASALEGAAVLTKSITLAGKPFSYKATTGHLTASDAVTGQPLASFFYIAYTAGSLEASKRPLTFFFNGGPGSASIWLHLGSFGPRRVVTSVPANNMPNPVQVVDNQETLLDHSDLVFVDAVGTGLSQAIAPKTNLHFYGVDADAAAFRDFVMRYITVNGRQGSPIYLFGESYGGPRAGVMANLLEVAGVRLAGVVLQSPAMNYNSNCGMFNIGLVSCEGYFPSYAATSVYHQKAVQPPGDFESYLRQARDFSATTYRSALGPFLASGVPATPAVLSELIAYTGLTAPTWSALSLPPGSYRANLMPGTAIGRYDARVVAPVGSAQAAGGDTSHALIDASFANTIKPFLANELGYITQSNYLIGNNIINRWNFGHDGKTLPDTIPDVAAAMTINPALKVVAMSGYYDLATPFYLTEMDMARLGSNPNVQIKNYHGGHMSYLDNAARVAQRADMVALYNSESVAK